MQQGPDHHIPDKKSNQQAARQNSGDKKPGNRLFRRHTIDDKNDRRRNKQAQGGRPGQGADHHIYRIVASGKLGNGHLADGCRSRSGRTGNRGKNTTAKNIHMEKPAGKMGQPRRQPGKHIFRQTGAKKNLSHPDKKRQGRQSPAVACTPDGGGHHFPQRGIGKKSHPGHAHSQERKSHPDTAAQQKKQQKK